MTSFVRVYFGPKKQVKLTRFDTIPELDEEQTFAAYCMAEDFDKLLWSDPGAGKTLTTIQAMMLVEEKLDDGEDERPDLTAIIAVPPIAIGTWVRWLTAAYEATGRWAVIQVIRSGSDVIRADATHVIISYGILSQRQTPLAVEALQGCNTAIFIADESDNLTGTDSNRTLRVFGKGFRGDRDSLVYLAQWRWFLSGTPIPRYNDGLYPVLRAIFPGKLQAVVGDKGQIYESIKTLRDYVSVFCRTELVKFGKMAKAKEKICGSLNNRALNRLLFDGPKPIAIRIKLEVPADLIEQEVTLTPKFSKEFLKLEDELANLPQLDFDARNIDPRVATAQRMMAVECAPLVANYVKDCFENDRQRNSPVTLGKVVLYVHTEAGNIIGNFLIRNGFRVRFINGSTDAQEDMETERRFNAGECDVVVGQIKAMGVAINLQERCDHVIFAEDTYSARDNEQARNRVYRRGQTRPVRVDYCRPISFLADIKVSSADRKDKSAREVLDGKE